MIIVLVYGCDAKKTGFLSMILKYKIVGKCSIISALYFKIRYGITIQAENSSQHQIYHDTIELLVSMNSPQLENHIDHNGRILSYMYIHFEKFAQKLQERHQLVVIWSYALM